MMVAFKEVHIARTSCDDGCQLLNALSHIHYDKFVLKK